MSEKPPRIWFRFSLRTMFVLVTVFCCWLGWESSVVRKRQAVLKEFRGKSAYQITMADEWVKRFPAGSPQAGVARIPQIRVWLGDQAIQEISYRSYSADFSAQDLARLQKTFPEATAHELPEELQIPCHPGCFPRGTLVDTPSGPRKIETILVGESLTAFVTYNEPLTAQVQSIFVTENRLWKIETDAGVLFTTQTQPLCLDSDKILPAGELQPGDKILRRDQGEIHPVTVLAVTPTDRKEKVFNLVLGDSEIFIAGGFLARSKPPALAATE